MRVCVDLNVWCADLLAARAGRQGTATQRIVREVRSGGRREPLQLVISWGMLTRLQEVLERVLGVSAESASALVETIADYARSGPSLALGGVGVLPIHDPEDRHVLETAWAGRADVLVTADFEGFLSADAEVRIDGQLALLRRGERVLRLAHPFLFAAWLGGVEVEMLDEVGQVRRGP